MAKYVERFCIYFHTLLKEQNENKNLFIENCRIVSFEAHE